MLQLTLFPDIPDNPPGPRWISPPWTTASDRWLEIDRDLPADHRARQISELVAALDLAPLVGSYAGLGSAAHPPELLVRLALFEIHRGCLSPAQWCEDCRYDDAVKWLVRGLRPSRSCLYQFRDRIGPYLDSWNRQILRRAKAEGWTSAKRAALDGTFAAAYASRHSPDQRPDPGEPMPATGRSGGGGFCRPEGQAPRARRRRRGHTGVGPGRRPGRWRCASRTRGPGRPRLPRAGSP